MAEYGQYRDSTPEINQNKTEIPRTDTWQSIGAIAARLVEKAKQERGK